MLGNGLGVRPSGENGAVLVRVSVGAHARGGVSIGFRVRKIWMGCIKKGWGARVMSAYFRCAQMFCVSLLLTDFLL